MNFFQYQDAARRNTAWLVVLFILAVALTVVALYLAVVLALELGGMLPHQPGRWWFPGIFAVVSLGTLALIGIGSGSKLLSLRKGGGVVAELLGGAPVRHDTDDPAQRRLLNIVEEMAIAAGAPVPSVYLLQQETGINAFAAGHSMNDAAIGVTRGAVDDLTRDELQGVIAHEFSHIVNNDVRLNLRLIGLLAGLLTISLAGRTLLRSMYWTGGGVGRRSRSDRDGKGAGAVMLIAVAMAVIGAVGMFFARMIKSAVSRQREFLADAAAVQFTRNPSGLAGALKKIGGYADGGKVQHPRAEEASHMFFSDAFPGSMLSGLFATHPPLPGRIARIDPSFDPSAYEEEVRRYASHPEEAVGFTGTEGRQEQAQLSPTEARLSIDPATVAAKVGSLSFANLAFGRRVIERLNPELRRSAHETMGAAAVACALLLDADAEIRRTQLQAVAASEIKGLAEEVRRVIPLVEQVDRLHRLPLVELLIPALRNMTPEQYASFKDVVAELVAADEKLAIFEFAILKVLRHQLDASFHGTGKSRTARISRLNEVVGDVAVVLSALAKAGSVEPDDRTRAFQAGMERLNLGDPHRHIYSKPVDSPFDKLDVALDRLAVAKPSIKQQVIDACAHTALADEEVTVNEYELLRAVAVSIDCPLPPFVPVVKVA